MGYYIYLSARTGERRGVIVGGMAVAAAEMMLLWHQGSRRFCYMIRGGALAHLFDWPRASPLTTFESGESIPAGKAP